MDRFIGVFVLTSFLYLLSLSRYYYKDDENMIYMIILCGIIYVFNYYKLTMYYDSLE